MEATTTKLLTTATQLLTTVMQLLNSMGSIATQLLKPTII